MHRSVRMIVMCGVVGLPFAGRGQTGAPRYQSPFGTAPATAPALPTPASITPGGTVVEDVVARVNDQIISRTDVERSEQQLLQELQQANAGPAERDQRQKDLLRDMIDQQLLLSRGKELGLNADAEVVRRLDEIRKQNHLDSMEDVEKAARSQGVSYEDFKAQIRNNAITQQVVRDEVGQRLRLSQGQEQTYYESHKQEFQQPEQVRLSEILVPTAEGATDAQVAQAQTKADALEARVKAGEAFDALAKKESGGPTAAQGGDLGLFKRGALAKVLEDQTFGLGVGEATAPIRTRQGFVVLKVTEHQQGGVAPLKQVEPQVQEAMYMEQMQPALRVYLTKLRENAYIDVKPGFVDSGASAKQTKPVFTAYAPPTPKKKVSEKARFDRARVGGATALASSAGGGASAGVTPATAVSAGPETRTGKTRESAQPVKVGKNGKVKIRREKVRYGQAPRNALPPGPEETVAGVGAGAATSTVNGGSGTTAGLGSAPGTALAPNQGTTEISSTSDVNPLTPKPVSEGKTRYSSRAPEVKAEKVQQKQAKVVEKAAATPDGPSAGEVATQKTQAAPLGLNGDTVKKKKVKRKKGEAKGRIQDRPAPVAPAAPAPTVNPDLGKSTPGTTPSADRTTLPPVSAPPPGANSTGQPLSPTGTPATDPSGTPTAPPTAVPQ